MTVIIEARKLLPFSTQQLWDTLEGPFTLRFDDGEIQTNHRDTCYSSHVWNFHREFPSTPLLKSHHLTHILKGKRLGAKTHLKLLGNVIRTVYDSIPDKTITLRDKLAKRTYEITNEMYNDLICRSESSVVSVDFLDFIGLMEHPDIKDILDNIEPTQESIDDAYDAVDKLVSGNRMPDSPVVKAYQAGLINRNQLMQMVAARGYLTDIDSVIFKMPITRGYVKGIRSFHDSLIESRSAAKSLYFNRDLLRDTEYFSRRLQLLCQIVERLHEGDCGSTNYLLWHVKPPVFDEGKEVIAGELENLVGKFYMDDDYKVLKPIRASDTHLYGKTLKLRSVVAGCAHPDPQGVCSTCYGELSFSIPADTNLGQINATQMTRKSSQGVLSTKHVDGTSVIAHIVLFDSLKPYFTYGEDKNSYYINDETMKNDTKLIVSGREAMGLTDIKMVSSVRELSPSRVSEIMYVGFLQKGDSNNVSAVNVSLNKRLASLSYEFLDHLKENPNCARVDERNNYVFDLKGWDNKKPILTLPLRHYNMSDHSLEIASIIESRITDLTERGKLGAPEATLAELFEVVNSMLSVNLAVLEIIIYATMVVSVGEKNFNLPKPWTTKELSVSDLNIASRSESAAMAYEYHRKTIISPASFFNHNRPSHIMDAFLMPRETIEDMELGEY